MGSLKLFGFQIKENSFENQMNKMLHYKWFLRTLKKTQNKHTLNK